MKPVTPTEPIPPQRGDDDVFSGIVATIVLVLVVLGILLPFVIRAWRWALN